MMISTWDSPGNGIIIPVEVGDAQATLAGSAARCSGEVPECQGSGDVSRCGMWNMCEIRMRSNWVDIGWYENKKWYRMGNHMILDDELVVYQMMKKVIYRSIPPYLIEVYSLGLHGFRLEGLPWVILSSCSFPMTDPCMLYIYMVTWIPSIYPLYVSIYIYHTWILWVLVPAFGWEILEEAACSDDRWSSWNAWTWPWTRHWLITAGWWKVGGSLRKKKEKDGKRTMENHHF